jgi:hypothetical protein
VGLACKDKSTSGSGISACKSRLLCSAESFSTGVLLLSLGAVSKESKIDGLVAAGVDRIDEGFGLGGVSKESKMDDFIWPEGAARLAGFGGGASKESKIEDCISSACTAGCSTVFGFGAGTSNESKIDDCMPPDAGSCTLGCTGLGTAKLSNIDDCMSWLEAPGWLAVLDGQGGGPSKVSKMEGGIPLLAAFGGASKPSNFLELTEKNVSCT